MRRELVAELRDFVEENRRATRNAEIMRSAAVLGRVTDGGEDSRVRRYKIGLDYFLEFAHFSRLGTRPCPPKDEVLRHLAMVEDALYVRLADFFVIADELYEALQSANRKEAP